MFKLNFIFIFLISLSVHAQDQRLCEYFGWNCSSKGSSKSGARTSSQSLPSSSTAANLNPGNVDISKKLGVETIYLPHNSMAFSLASGNGRVGGALISPVLESSFFGNRALELSEVTLDRETHHHRYQNRKLNGAFAVNLLGNKIISLDGGASAKWNPEIKHINWGVGFSGRFLLVNFGAAFYRDDVQIKLENYVNPSTNIPYKSSRGIDVYRETYKVETYSLGTQIKNWAIDFGAIQNKYQFFTENTRIYIYSAAYISKNWLFNLALRKESSPFYTNENGKMIEKRTKTDVFYGGKYSVNKHLVLGINYNYFLINELSANVTLFL